MQERREIVLSVFGILLFIILFGVTYTRVIPRETGPQGRQAAVREDTTECTECHEMLPEIMTWQISSHSKIPCTKCHTGNTTDYKSKHDNKTFSKPIKIKDGIPNEVCNECHTENREYTPSGDLIIPHDRHAAAGVTCVKCHSGVVHARIADRDLTSEADLANYQSWNPGVAKKLATSYYSKPNMWTCVNCHRQASVSRKCNTCHTAIQSLPSHDQPNWNTQHGRFARDNISDCAKCHVTPGVDKFETPSTGNLAADFSRAQEFCYSCHLKRPEMHEDSMMPVHPKRQQKEVSRIV